MAQVSNSNQILVWDFNGDSNLDAVIAGNPYGSEVATPRNDAGIGLFLSGDGKGGFRAVPARQSGLYIPGDNKDLTCIRIKGVTYILAAKNDEPVQFIKADGITGDHGANATRGKLENE